jgi:hypothetical protein
VSERKQQTEQYVHELWIYGEEETSNNKEYNHQLARDKIYNQKYSKLERSRHHSEQVQKVQMY